MGDDDRALTWDVRPMRGRTRLRILLACVAALIGADAAPAAAAVDATLRQVGCAASTALPGCGPGAGIGGPGQPAVSPDGEHVYVPGSDDDALVDFKRDPATGALARVGCYGNAALGCVPVPGLDRPWAAGVSPDGEYVYVVSSAGGGDGKLFAFQRQGDNLSLPLCFSALVASGCTTAGAGALAGTTAVFARDDSVYVASGTADGVIGFRRLATGTHVVANCVGAAAGCSPEPRFTTPTDIVVAPDGARAYVSSYHTPDRLVALDRAADGTLSPRTDVASCVAFSNVPGCGKRPAGRETNGLALSPDGRQLYAASQYQYGGGEALELFDVPGDGSIVPRAGGCWSSVTMPGCTKVQGMELSPDVAVTPDGRAVFAASLDGVDRTPSADDGYVVSFARSADGMLAPQPSPFGCLSTVARQGCGTLDRGGRMRHMAVTPDSRHLYAVGTPGDGGATRLLSFRIDRAPACAPVGATTPFNTALLLRLSCHDADGDALSYEIVSHPQRGFLGSLQGDGSVPYAPLGGLSGADGFTYRASAAGIASDPATATVDVQPLPGPGGGGGGWGGPAAAERIGATVRPFWLEYRRYVVLRRLRISGLAEGAEVQVRCKGRGCPFKHRSFRARDGRANASKEVRRGKLRPRARIQVRITKPGAIGKVVIYKVARKGLPKGRIRCLPPGAAKPAAC
jgi:DNA-binding beta-propeller fold protein YncE